MLTINKKYQSNSFDYVVIEIEKNNTNLNFRRKIGDLNWYQENKNGRWYRDDKFNLELNKLFSNQS